MKRQLMLVGDGRLELRGELKGATTRLAIEGRGGAWSLLVRTDQKSACETTPVSPASWPLCRGLPRRGWSQDPFIQAARTAHDELYPPFHDHGRLAISGDVASALMRKVYRMVRALAIATAERCDPLARRVALRFLPDARWYIYSHLIRDRTGRLAQLADACPGALLLAHALDSCDRRPEARKAASRLWSDAVAGRPLPALLDEALDVWQEHAFDGGPQAQEIGWLRLASASEKQRRRIRMEQRLLVRRASTVVPTTLLWLPPPVLFAPEDLPTQPRALATWFRATKVPALLGPHGPLLPAQRAQLSAFVSRHALALRGRARPAQVASRIHQAVDCVAALSRVPTRSSNPVAFQRAVMAFHHALAVTRAPADLLTRALPAPPLPAWRDGEFEIEPITSATGLVAEGDRMHHCAASYLRSVAAGRSAVYTARLGTQRLTVSLCGTRAGWCLDQIAGAANRQVTRAELANVERWLLLVGGRRGSRSIRGHRVQQRVDAKRVADAREAVEELAVIALPLEGIAKVGVVRAQHHDVAVPVEDGARVRLAAEGPALRCLTTSHPESDRGNLRHRIHLVEHVEHRVGERKVDDGVLAWWKGFPDLLGPVVPRALAPEIVSPEESALQQIVAQVRRFMEADATPVL